MLTWTQGLDEYSATCDTRLVRMRIDVDMAYTQDVRNIRFIARVDNATHSRLSTVGNIPSMDAAKAWCEAEYRRVLQEELDGLNVAAC